MMMSQERGFHLISSERECTRFPTKRKKSGLGTTERELAHNFVYYTSVRNAACVEADWPPWQHTIYFFLNSLFLIPEFEPASMAVIVHRVCYNLKLFTVHIEYVQSLLTGRGLVVFESPRQVSPKKERVQAFSGSAC